MLKGKLVSAQLNAHLPRAVFAQCVERYAGKYPTLSFSHWDQLLCLRDITTCLNSHCSKLYYAGFRSTIARSTLADANERRDSRIFEDFALHLIGIARPLYAQDSLAVELAQTVYAIDASTIDLCLSLFTWAPAPKDRTGIKLHTLLDLRGNIPAFIRITGALVPDASFLDDLRLEAGSFYVMDRGYRLGLLRCCLYLCTWWSVIVLPGTPPTSEFVFEGPTVAPPPAPARRRPLTGQHSYRRPLNTYFARTNIIPAGACHEKIC